jgi:hypothetical protein
MPVECASRSGPDSNQDLVVLGNGRSDLSVLDNVR